MNFSTSKHVSHWAYHLHMTSMKVDITKRSKVTSSNWPRFIAVSSIVEGALNKQSPFAIQKATVSLAGKPKLVFCNVTIKVTAHSSLNSSKGEIRHRDLGVSEEDFLPKCIFTGC